MWSVRSAVLTAVLSVSTYDLDSAFHRHLSLVSHHLTYRGVEWQLACESTSIFAELVYVLVRSVYRTQGA
jgi:hypothetical protein